MAIHCEESKGKGKGERRRVKERKEKIEEREIEGKRVEEREEEKKESKEKERESTEEGSMTCQHPLLYFQRGLLCYSGERGKSEGGRDVRGRRERQVEADSFCYQCALHSSLCQYLSVTLPYTNTHTLCYCTLHTYPEDTHTQTKKTAVVERERHGMETQKDGQ